MQPKQAFEMKLYQRGQVSRTYPFKVLVDLFVLVLIWQPD